MNKKEKKIGRGWLTVEPGDGVSGYRSWLPECYHRGPAF